MAISSFASIRRRARKLWSRRAVCSHQSKVSQFLTARDSHSEPPPRPDYIRAPQCIAITNYYRLATKFCPGGSGVEGAQWPHGFPEHLDPPPPRPLWQVIGRQNFSRHERLLSGRMSISLIRLDFPTLRTADFPANGHRVHVSVMDSRLTRHSSQEEIISDLIALKTTIPAFCAARSPPLATG